ncbi:uncharacterized protein LOC131239934 isoform X2 [Magnolia sinica]|uniref:uncharacterized protein LOC131239934 isoform X2 n=1 Tax=Magnolia sinica TaxID=86752 RepID=UPI00265A2240|nr:uncharacterized protein LOC131239934 isoform X2 [Magnolia sinica]
MCHTQNHPMKTTKPTSKPKPARKTRTKTRKPKFLSLSLSMSLEQQLSPETTQMTNPQLTLFPLHPENLFEEKESNDNNVAYLLEQEGGGGATLNGLLGGTGTSEDSQSLSPSLLTYAYGGQDKDSEGASTLAQAALRQKKERDVSEEKWVLYSDVVEENKEEEISSYSYNRQQEFGLSLKLDYQEILNAWSDKGSLYIGEDKEEECPQTVPDQPQDDDTSTTNDQIRFVVFWKQLASNSPVISNIRGEGAYHILRTTY